MTLKYEKVPVSIVDTILSYPGLIRQLKIVADWLGKPFEDDEQFVIWLTNFCYRKEMKSIEEIVDGRIAALEVFCLETGHVSQIHRSLLAK